MGIRQKFFVLAGIVGALMAIVSISGYFLASADLEQSVDNELRAVVAKEVSDMDGWLMAKQSSTAHTANVMTAYNGTRPACRRMPRCSRHRRRPMSWVSRSAWRISISLPRRAAI